MPDNASVAGERHEFGGIQHAAHALVPGFATPAEDRNVRIVDVPAVLVHDAVRNIGQSCSERQRSRSEAASHIAAVQGAQISSARIRSPAGLIQVKKGLADDQA
jgi:hypothetical protein